jgi:hypothetical protein
MPGPGEASVADGAPATLLVNANVLTMDPRAPRASALTMADGVIRSVGADETDRRPGLRRMDLGGATVVPGFIDTHVHAGVTGIGRFATQLDSIAGVGAALAALAADSAETGVGRLVVGTGFDPGAAGRFPTPDELDAAGGGRPVYVMGAGGHHSVVNRAALDLIDGVATSGVLKGDNNMAAFTQLWRRLGDQVGLERALAAAAADAAAGGITTMHTMDPLHVTEALVSRSWPVNVVPYAETFDVDAVQALGLPQIGGCGPVALDGDVDPHTAALLEPYTDDPGASGVLRHSTDDLLEFVGRAHRAGMQVALHCVGSGAIDQLLTVYQRAIGPAGIRLRRHRIEHFEIPGPGQAQRAATLGVSVSVQPAFNHLWPHHRGYPEVLGAARAEMVDPVRSLMEAGVATGFGSDSPVTPLRPLLGIHAAVNHSNPSERVGVAAALRAYTSDAAGLAHQAGERGRIAVGCAADLVILDDDPITVAPDRISAISVLATTVGGRFVFAAGQSETPR